MRLLAMVFSLSVIVVAVVLGSPWSAFVHVPRLLFVLFLSTSIVLTRHGVYHSYDRIRLLLSGEGQQSEQAEAFVQSLCQATTVSGWLGFLIGLIQSLASNAGVSSLWSPGSAVLLPVLYASVLVHVIYRPLADSKAAAGWATRVLDRG